LLRLLAVERIIEADPVAVCVRALMAERDSWAGTASDLLRAASGLAGHKVSNWPQNSGALAGRLRRAQTFLRMLGIEISGRRVRSRIVPCGAQTSRLKPRTSRPARGRVIDSSQLPLWGRESASRNP
jgi:hypothetical protein